LTHKLEVGKRRSIVSHYSLTIDSAAVAYMLRCSDILRSDLLMSQFAMSNKVNTQLLAWIWSIKDSRSVARNLIAKIQLLLPNTSEKNQLQNRMSCHYPACIVRIKAHHIVHSSNKFIMMLSGGPSFLAPYIKD